MFEQADLKMDIKKIRNVHLYLGCFFAPLIILFIFTGAIQTLGWHNPKYGSYDPNQGTVPLVYEPSSFIKIVTTMHMNRGYKLFWFQTSNIYRYFVLTMAFGLLVTIILGILMAFKFTNPTLVWFMLGGGILVPILLILLK